MGTTLVVESKHTYMYQWNLWNRIIISSGMGQAQEILVYQS